MTKDKKIFIIGAGNMAKPVILSLLKSGLTPNQITIVTGSSEGKNKAALLQYLTENNVCGFNDCITEKTPPTNLPPQDVIIYAAKPKQFSTIARDYTHLVSPKAQVISIAAGLSMAKIKAIWGAHISVIRTMPHLPCVLYGIYAPAGVDTSMTEHIFTAMGTPERLENEDEAFHVFSTHSGCGPAFVAQYLASGGKLPIQPESDFYKQWLAVAIQDFGNRERAERILNTVISGTMRYLECTGITPYDFAQQVRSEGGMTDAGLRVMEQLSVAPEQSIASALRAATMRSREMIAHQA